MVGICGSAVWSVRTGRKITAGPSGAQVSACECVQISEWCVKVSWRYVQARALGRIFMPGAGTGAFSTNFPCNIPKTYDIRAVLMIYLGST